MSIGLTSICTSAYPNKMDGADIKALRLRLGLTQTEFGKRIGGASLRAVQKWEKDQATPIRAHASALQRLQRSADRRAQ